MNIKFFVSAALVGGGLVAGGGAGILYFLKDYSTKFSWPDGSIGVKVWFDQEYISKWKINGDGIFNDFFEQGLFKPEKNTQNLAAQAKSEEAKLFSKNVNNNLLPTLSIPENWKNRKYWSKNFVLTGIKCEDVKTRLDDLFKKRTESIQGYEDFGLNKLWVEGNEVKYKTGYRSLFSGKAPIPVTLVAGGISCSELKK